MKFFEFFEFNTYFTAVVPTALLLQLTGQSQESEGPYKPARIKEVHTKLHSFQASLCTLHTHSYSFNTDICLHIHSAECTVRLLNQACRNNYPYNPKYVGNTGNRTRDLWLVKCIGVVHILRNQFDIFTLLPPP